MGGCPGSHNGGMKNAPSNRSSVFVVEDSAPIRERLIALLEAMEGVRVVGEAGTADEAVEGILRTRPRSVLLDIQLARGTGIDVLREVRSQVPETVFIVLTNHGGPQYRRICLAAGATYFVDKSETPRVREIIAGLDSPAHESAASKHNGENI